MDKKIHGMEKYLNKGDKGEAHAEAKEPTSTPNKLVGGLCAVSQDLSVVWVFEEYLKLRFELKELLIWIVTFKSARLFTP